MTVRVVLLVVFAACGRVNFDPIADTSLGGDAVVGGDAIVEPPGLLLHFAFEADGLLHDRSTGHHDAVCAPACPTPAAGRVGAGAASFDGSQCLRIADAPELRSPAFTFMLWFRPSGGGIQSAFGRPLDGATAGTNTFEAFLDNADLWKVAVNTQAVNTPTAAGAWHHLVGVFDGNAIAMYFDGAPRGTPRVVGAAVFGPDDLDIGCDVNSGTRSNQVIGLIDEVRLYDRALTAAEIAALAALQ